MHRLLETSFLHQGELSVLGIALLAQIVNQCRIDIHQGEIREEPARQALWETRLADWLDIPVWVESWRVEERICYDVFLSEKEMHCAEQRFREPRREGTAHTLSKEAASRRTGSTSATGTLGALLAQEEGRSALSSRLDKNCVAPYEPDDFVGLDMSQSRMIWTWDNGDIHPTSLVCLPMPDQGAGLPDALPLLIPSAWGKLVNSWHGHLHLHEGHVLVVCDETGQYGLIRLQQIKEEPVHVVGQWLQPCSWLWLSGAESSSRVIEVAQQVSPDIRGELVCDLMDVREWQRINPVGTKGLMGTSHYSGTNFDGCMVVNEAGYGAYPRVLGRMTRQGVFKCGQAAPDGYFEPVPWGADDLRWLEIGSESEHMSIVRSPDSGLWGYVDRYEAIAIEPQYDDAWSFNYGTAKVLPLGNPCVGLIDKAGHWVLPPSWKNLWRWSRQVIVAESTEGDWGAIDVQGRVIVPFAPYATWLQHPDVCERLADYQIGRSWINDRAEETRRTVIEVIATIWKREFRERILIAVQGSLNEGSSLAGLEGLFDGDTNERDLREGGVWGLRVTLLRDKTEGFLQPKTGETGQICCYYPVGLSTFDLSIEAPVMGLASSPDASVGIPWRDLSIAPL